MTDKPMAWSVRSDPAAYTELALECGALSATAFAYNGRTQKFYTFSTDELEEFCTRLMVDALQAKDARLARLEADAEKLIWLEQQHWDSDELYNLVNNWTTKDGKRYPQGLSSAIDAARSTT